MNYEMDKQLDGVDEGTLMVISVLKTYCKTQKLKQPEIIQQSDVDGDGMYYYGCDISGLLMQIGYGPTKEMAICNAVEQMMTYIYDVYGDDAFVKEYNVALGRPDYESPTLDSLYEQMGCSDKVYEHVLESGKAYDILQEIANELNAKVALSVQEESPECTVYVKIERCRNNPSITQTGNSENKLVDESINLASAKVIHSLVLMCCGPVNKDQSFNSLFQFI